jgi:hypothetical protein
MLGNVVTNTASGTISMLSEPRTVIMARFLVLGLRAHELVNGQESASVQMKVAAVNTSILACVVLNNVAASNPRAFYDALSRAEMESAVISLLHSLAANAPEKVVDKEDANRSGGTNEEQLIQYLRIVLRTIRCFIRLQNSCPHYCNDPFWTYPVQQLVSNHTSSSAVNRLLRPFQPSKWSLISSIDRVLHRFTGPLVSVSQEPNALNKAFFSTSASCIDAFGICFLLLSDVLSAAGLEGLLTYLRSCKDVDLFTSAAGTTTGTIFFKTQAAALPSSMNELVSTVLARYGSSITNMIQFTFNLNHDAKPPPVADESKQPQDVSKTQEEDVLDEDFDDEAIDAPATKAADKERASSRAKKAHKSTEVTAIAPTNKKKREDRSGGVDFSPLLGPAFALTSALLDCAYDSVLDSMMPTASIAAPSAAAAKSMSRSKHEGMLLAVFRASYLCPDSRSIHKSGLKILATIAAKGTSGLFPADIVTKGNPKQKNPAKVGQLKINEDTLLNHSAAQLKPTTGAKSKVAGGTENIPEPNAEATAEANSAGGGSADNAKPEAMGRIVQCANFVLAAAALCEYDADFYSQFGAVMKSLASSSESSREVSIRSKGGSLLIGVNMK